MISAVPPAVAASSSMRARSRHVVAGRGAVVEEEQRGRRHRNDGAGHAGGDAADGSAARATMQTNSGAGLGIGTKCRSTRKASSAVAVVRAGPEIARQFNCMPVLATCRE